MVNQDFIKEGISKLVNGQIVVFALCIVLIAVTVAVMVLALKFKLLTVKSKLPLVLALVLCSALLISAKLVRAVPILRDYNELSYTVAEDVTLVVQEGTTGIVDRTNNVFVTDADGQKITLLIEDGSGLETGLEYVGKVAYTRHSGYVVWFDLTPKPLSEAESGSAG